MNLFITGGTGTLGHELVKQYMDIADKIVIYSRDEAKQAAMRAIYPEGGSTPVHYRIGDVRDYERTLQAMSDCDTVIHTAAMKRIDTCESEAYECMRTNIDGTANVARACNATGRVKKAMFISTDKACDPISLYGMAKAFAERLWIQSNIHGTCSFAAMRYGNVKGSKGSVHEMWEKRRGQCLEVTHNEMTRFFWTIQEAAQFCRLIMDTQERGVVYVPKMQSFRMIDVAKEFSSNIKITGIRCNEKIHERLIAESDITLGHARDRGDYFAIYPVSHEWNATQCMRGKKITSMKGITSEVPEKEIGDLLDYLEAV